MGLVNVVSYVPLRGVISCSGHQLLLSIVSSYVPLRGVIKLPAALIPTVMVSSYVPLRGVMALLRKLDNIK